MKRLEISFRDPELSGERLRQVRTLVTRYPGRCPLYLRIHVADTQTLIATGIQISPDTGLINTLADVVVRECVTTS